MTWLVLGQVMGFGAKLFVDEVLNLLIPAADGIWAQWFSNVVGLSLCYGVAAIVGFVVVGQMLSASGSCVLVS